MRVLDAVGSCGKHPQGVTGPVSHGLSRSELVFPEQLALRCIGGYSDDERLETMTDILQEAAQRMQVILLTCRSKAFRHLDGNRITLR
jgi:hypothetical protein